MTSGVFRCSDKCPEDIMMKMFLVGNKMHKGFKTYFFGMWFLMGGKWIKVQAYEEHEH